MQDPEGTRAAIQRSVLAHPALACILLITLWAVSTLPGLNAVGLINWQESARALVAQRMHTSGDWIVPTIADQPYLAKPPMLYWAELTLCRLTGRPPGEAELRSTVALAGLTGVLLTYFAGRSILCAGVDRGGVRSSAESSDELNAIAALWAGIFLATGILYVRSSRIGELDILLAPWTVGAIWGCTWAWVREDAGLARRMLAIVLASVCCAGAALTKGPPALLSIGLGIVGGIGLWTAWECAPRPRAGRTTVAAMLCGCALMAAGAWVNRDALGSVRAWLGIVLLGCIGCAAGLMTPLFQRSSLSRVLEAVWKSGIVPALATGVLGLWAWSRAVEARLGAEVIARTASQEASDNLRALSFESPIQNLEAAVYAVGVGSIACIAALAWLVTQPPRISRSWWVLLAWLVLGLAFFSLAGRGTGRYLTPLWPAVALLGGVWITRATRDLAGGIAIARGVFILVFIIACTQAYWYSAVSPAKEAERSSRGLMRELLAPEHGVDRSRLAAIDFWVGSLDFYAGHHVLPVIDIGPWIDFPHEETSVDAFLDQVDRDRGTWTVLIRQTPSSDPLRPAKDVGMSPPEHFASLLKRRGMQLRAIPLESSFRLDRRTTEVGAFRIVRAPLHTIAPGR